MSYISRLFSYIRSLSLRAKIIGGALVAVAVVALFHFAGGAPAQEATQRQTHVALASVASLSQAGGPLPVVGRVTSKSEATLTALQGGQITGVPYKLGARVGVGAVIASFENSSQRASMLQAQGQYDAALAAQRSVSPQDTAAAARNTYASAYNTLDITLASQIDLLFGNPGPYGPDLLIDAPMYAFGELSRDRAAVKMLMEEYRAALSRSGDPEALLVYAGSVVARVSAFVDKLSVAANRRGAFITAEQFSAVSSARSTLAGLTATLASAQQSYRAGSVTTTTSTDAQVTIALGGLRAAQASLEKTYVRAPIAGTIVSLPVNQGDFVGPGSIVAVISNPGALEVEAYVTAVDAKTVSVGGKATVDKNTAGVVTFVAPAIDPAIGKVQVKVGLPAGSGLVDGTSVAVVLEREQKQSAAGISIPLAAAKVTPQGPVVFTVASSTLVAVPVTFGGVVGGRVAILSGLTLDMDIVADARGLVDGQSVVVDPI